MICKKIYYSHFRNIESAVIEPEPGVNLLYGENAEGKTNALEGMYLLAQGRSHRTVHENEFIMQGSAGAAIQMVYADARREQRLEMRFLGKGKKVCAKNGVYLKKMSEFIGNFPVIGDNNSGNAIVMSRNEFRCRMNDDIRAQNKRILEKWR